MSIINPKPRKLTLDKALFATRQPLARLGELVHVQVTNELKNQPDFPNGEVRSTFAPSAPNRDGSFQREFHQPVTEQHLRKLYDAGGWIESLEHFSDEALALYFDYRGGLFSGNCWAGDVGNATDYETDCNAALALQALPTAEVIDAIRKTTLLAHKRYKLASGQGVKASARQSMTAKRSRGIKNAYGNTLDDVINNLKKNHPNEKPSELWPRLYAAIEEWCDGNCQEINSDRKDSRGYLFQKGENQDTITFGTFRKKLKK